ncbi:hypothetical protein [Corynebacterium lujinxingii]|uniref:Uncharacterized protein n=1 Tax=Corynebacterium lujinxingii TaxID=2763010 RepID=A0A7H0JZ23_9CORY|nr:hypothetical protein [Corynebacterium lujinxingii]MBC3179270.1 hypothetical protein [Corynebacterium lujinxingii]QNP90289.1 hypothetical protein IAU68_00325 [Corynebacterium lujinxingii]
MAKVVNTATNLGALLVFGFGGYMAITLALANVVGAQIGTKLVRIALLVLVVVLCAKLLQDQ